METTKGEASLAQIETLLCELVGALEPAPAATRRHRGRPPILPALLLWSGVVVGVLRGVDSLRAIWRMLSASGLWAYPAVPVTDDAVTKRLLTAGPAGLATLFADLTTLLLARTAPRTAADLARFAPAIYALDETTLDPVARRLPTVRGLPAHDHRLLPGKLAGAFDLRRQLWHSIIAIDDPDQNERIAAPALVRTLPPRSLLLFDLGYFGFAWLDDLTDAGYHWITRLPAKVSWTLVHSLSDDGETRDLLIWLGAHRADRAKHLVRLVQLTVGAHTHTYLTNVTDPARLPVGEIAQLYARRWDIERAIDLAKTHLGLHLLWSSKPALIAIQVWAVLIIAQMIQALRSVVAEAAAVPVEEVSVRLLVRYFPQYAARHADPVAAYVADGRRLGFLRPSRRFRLVVPDIPPTAYSPPPADLPRTRTPRYGHRTSGRRPRYAPRLLMN